MRMCPSYQKVPYIPQTQPLHMVSPQQNLCKIKTLIKIINTAQLFLDPLTTKLFTARFLKQVNLYHKIQKIAAYNVKRPPII